jgi:hypothetical protein
MENTLKDYVISVNPDNNKVTMFVRELGVSFDVGTDAELAVLGDWEIDKDIRGKISMITRMCKNKTFAPTVLSMPQHKVAFDFKDFMNMIMINYSEQVNPINPTIQ